MLIKLHCDFCDRTEEEVKWLALGKRGAAICRECAALALKLLPTGDQPTVTPPAAPTAAAADQAGG
ncbi:ClpX C4-type zinc finger protein [Aquabacterium sp. OR-4]|uniref:ClpX C4-type zinc finger protein n=1 Tax=Aquabacterium sp. OR-4 TaxID=2978127 RepID=UPI0021B472EA|nr:ClpX C4-type zinc finger protein [Aquabacterium sp. OR-4]MDT7834989.1 ClpX C4-type zinc finger protein [Aquabacterium sp. OR-4]